ncbi:transcriptional regulator BetI [Roseobacter denitrificans]|uniref:HTH-type transcriptional regulator BetI n=1 Tax=Roseobacter denitrificans (strain ATCC 33942 / OCh 114) TaxID=375451 RepID=Q168G9_ROSDO|nr:transcriptional regulator BetI [Roseobacter denitrificans]ABG31624.1 HTH-type transcriptional regulator BetI, putative [Roseobacter denitrificans OCh 114]AVL54607.1 transcriptional regulator BetI [Roseobacter denitrificans]SFF89155.1 transcriptional regulator, TetR family [Roseobacter denitrificans OCh 114]
MPKVGMEPIRRTALVNATIAEIGARGSLDVTVGQIAKRAGMSTALAHHYFGGKDQIFLAAMQQILRDFGAEVRRGLRAAPTPRARVEALIDASFAPSCFTPSTISAWMTLYASAATNPDTLRLLRVYQQRLHSNLIHALRPISSDPVAHAEVIAALIDGLYLRAALSRSKSADAARDTALAALSTLLERPA